MLIYVSLMIATFGCNKNLRFLGLIFLIFIETQETDAIHPSQSEIAFETQVSDALDNSISFEEWDEAGLVSSFLKLYPPNVSIARRLFITLSSKLWLLDYVDCYTTNHT